jgi:hypothetical protein
VTAGLGLRLLPQAFEPMPGNTRLVEVPRSMVSIMQAPRACAPTRPCSSSRRACRSPRPHTRDQYRHNAPKKHTVKRASAAN